MLDCENAAAAVRHAINGGKAGGSTLTVEVARSPVACERRHVPDAGRLRGEPAGGACGRGRAGLRARRAPRAPETRRARQQIAARAV